MKNYTLGLYEKAMPANLDWREKLEAVREAGYDCLEISIDETDEKLKRLDMSREERAFLMNACMVTGVFVRTMCLSGHRRYPMGSSDPAVEKRSMEIMEKAILLADDLGIRIIQLAGYDVYYEAGNQSTRERFSKNLIRAVEMAAARGIILGFETMETEFMNTVKKSMVYVNKTLSPYMAVYPDLGNITNAAKLYGTAVEEDLQCGKSHIVAIHLKETSPGVFREVPFGEGHVDFETGIAKAWELGVRKYVVECWYTGEADWREKLLAARKKMSDILDRQE